MILEVAWDDPSALKHDADAQLRRGGLYVAVDASALPPLAELTLRLRCGEFSVEAAARLTVATAEAACVEIAPEALAPLVAAVDDFAGGAVARPGAALARLVDLLSSEQEVDTRGQIPLERKIATMSVGEKVQLALHGNRDARHLLMRDRAGVVQSSLVRNPKVTLDEIQALARAPQLAPEAAELLAQHPVYGMSPQVALALVRNPRTPLPIATQMIARLQPADLRAVAKGLGVRAQVAAAARKRLIDR